MAIVKTFGKEYSYVLKCDRDLPTDKQTQFIYKLPSLESRFGGNEEISFKGDPKRTKDLVTTIKSGGALKSSINVIQSSLVRIVNLLNDNGEKIKWPLVKEEQDKILASFNPKWIIELAEAFSLILKIDEEEEKN